MQQYTFTRKGHESTRTVILLKGQVILQTMKKDCGCQSCNEQHDAIAAALAKLGLKYHTEYLDGVTFFRIQTNKVTSAKTLQNFLSKELNLSIDEFSCEEKVTIEAKVKVPYFYDVCGDAAKSNFFSKFMWAVLGNRGSKSLNSAYNAALAGKVIDKKRLDNFYQKAKKVRKDFLAGKPHNDEFTELRDSMHKVLH